MVFSRFLRQIDKEYYAKLEADVLKNIDKNLVHQILETKISKLLGKDFFIIFRAISKNFDQDCQTGFSPLIKLKKEEYLDKKEIKPKKKNTQNKFTSFVNQLIIQQADVAELAYIESSRFSKILNGKFIDFYAFEVILLANICKLSPFKLFNYFYGDGERPLVGLVPDSKKKGEGESEAG